MNTRGSVPPCAVDPADVEARVINLNGKPTISLRSRSTGDHLGDYRSVEALAAAGWDLASLTLAPHLSAVR